MAFPFGFGDVPRLRCKTGDRFGERLIIIDPPTIKILHYFLHRFFCHIHILPFSFSGEGDDPPPVAEFLRDGVKRTVASK